MLQFISLESKVKNNVSHSDYWWGNEYQTISSKSKVLKSYDFRFADPKRPTGSFPIPENYFDTFVLPKIDINPVWKSNVFIAHTHKPNIVVLGSPELVGHLVHRAGISLERIKFIALQEWQVKAVQTVHPTMKKEQIQQIKVKGSQMESLKSNLTEDQYDAVIMNPDWDLTGKFVDIANTIVKSTGTIVVIHDAKYANDHNWNRVAEFEYTGNSFANVQLTSAVTVLKKQDVSETLLKDAAGNMMAVLPETIKVGPAGDLAKWHFTNTVLGYGLEGYESYTGSLMVNDKNWVDSIDPNAFEVVQTVGGKDKPLEIAKVDSAKQLENVGADQIMVVMGVDYDCGKIGPLKIKPKGVGIGYRVRGIPAKNMAEAKRIIDHLQSPEVGVLVSVLKGYTAKNGVKTFRKIPQHNEQFNWKKV